jgi:hypothetical protein
MRIRRGLFRLWIVGTAIWAIIVIVITASSWNGYLPEQNYLFPTTPSGDFSRISRTYDSDFTNTHWEVTFPNNVALHIPVGIAEEIVAKQAPRFSAKFVSPRDGERRQQQIEMATSAAGAIIGVPAVILALGSALAWAFSGFRASSG